jgi:hypothetical protein
MPDELICYLSCEEIPQISFKCCVGSIDILNGLGVASVDVGDFAPQLLILSLQVAPVRAVQVIDDACQSFAGFPDDALHITDRFLDGREASVELGLNLKDVGGRNLKKASPSTIF